MSAILIFCFFFTSKRENNYIVQKKIIQNKQKDKILHNTFTFSLKQGETRTRSGPICVQFHCTIISMVYNVNTMVVMVVGRNHIHKVDTFERVA